VRVCHVMDKFFADHADVRALRERNFVTLKINKSPANENREFLSRYQRCRVTRICSCSTRMANSCTRSAPTYLRTANLQRPAFCEFPGGLRPHSPPR